MRTGQVSAAAAAAGGGWRITSERARYERDGSRDALICVPRPLVPRPEPAPDDVCEAIARSHHADLRQAAPSGAADAGRQQRGQPGHLRGEGRGVSD